MKFLALILVNILLSPLYAVFWLTALLVTFLPIFPSKVGLKNLRERLQTSRLRAHVILTNVFFGYVIYFFEAAVLFPLGLCSVENENESTAVFSALKEKFHPNAKVGFACLGAHFSNIEEAGGNVARSLAEVSDSRFVCLAKPGAISLVTKFFDWYRGLHKIDVLWTNRKDLVRAMLLTAKQGNSIGYLIDQKPAGRGIFIEFFGKFCAFPFAGLEVALKAKMPVVHVTFQRIFPGRFRCIIEEGFQPHLGESCDETSPRFARYLKEGITSSEIPTAQIMACYVRWLEETIRRAPAQWAWDYKKWSRNPPTHPSDR